jgi:hypothetical protein
MAFMVRVDLSWIHAGCPRIEQTASGFEVINFPFPKLFRPHLHASMSLGHFLLAALAKQFKQGSTIWIIKQLLLVTAKEDEKTPRPICFILLSANISWGFGTESFVGQTLMLGKEIRLERDPFYLLLHTYARRDCIALSWLSSDGSFPTTGSYKRLNTSLDFS